MVSAGMLANLNNNGYNSIILNTNNCKCLILTFFKFLCLYITMVLVSRVLTVLF